MYLGADMAMNNPALQAKTKCHGKGPAQGCTITGEGPAQNPEGTSYHDHVVVSFVCTHPAGLAEQPLVAENAAKHCNRAESRTVRADGPACEQQGWGFSPFA
jgi:hypothetical protein